MKRLLSAIIMVTMLATASVASARLTVTGPNITGHEDWLEEMQADTRVKKILDGNIAFVDNCKKAWVNDKIVELTSPARYVSEREEFEISVQDANSIFGINESGSFVSNVKITSRTSLECFIDPRGFAVFGKVNPVDTTLPSNYSWYKDYMTVGDAMGYIAWEDVEFTTEERIEYMEKWRGALSVPKGKEAEYEDFINTCILAAETAASKIIPDGNGGYNIKNIVFTDYDLTTWELKSFKTAIKSAFKEVSTMATGYICMSDKTTPKAKELRAKILGCIDFLFKLYSQGWNYNLDSKQSWVTTQFEIPLIASNVLCLMYDDPELLDENGNPTAKMISYTDALFDKNPIPDVRTAGVTNNNETYTNRLWRCFGFFHTAVVANDTYRMNYAMKYTSSAYMYTARNNGFGNLTFGKDGFYHDGSMIFHNKTPYNMGYGMSYAGLVYEFLELTKDTKFDIRKVYAFENVYDFCIDSFIPFTSNGITMRMAHGRASTNSDIAILRPCAYIAVNAPEEHRNRIISALKAVIGDRAFATGSMNYELNVPTMTELYNKYQSYAANVLPVESDEKSKVYYNQDEVIHHSDKFTAALQMSSQRIAKYEAIVPTNETGWYLGDGMLYVYTDNKQYGTEYFNKVNPYYMPGTTVDSTPRKAVSTDTAISEGTWGYPDNDWAGGVSDGENTVAGYEIGNYYVSQPQLKGRKSYFMIGDKIVCMGTGISDGMGNVYTVVENRIISKESAEKKAIEIGYSPVSIVCTNEEDNETAWLTVDGSANTSLPLGDIGEYIIYDFGKKVNLGKVGMAFLYGDERRELAKIQLSDDGVTFTDVCDFASTGTSTDIELYDINCSGRYFKIVSLGNEKNAYFNLSEITFYKDTATVEQIEESRLLITEGFDDLVVDGEVQEPVFNKTHSVINPEWVWLENQQGFVFLKDAKLDVKRERMPSSPVFMQLCIDHGEKPSQEEYAYVQLPKASADETREYAKNQNIEILEMNNDVHAVYDKEENKIYANVFKKGTVLDGITFETPCIVIIDKNKSSIYITDPTWKSDKVSFLLPDGYTASGGDLVKYKNNTVMINTSVRRGEAHTVRYRNKNTALSDSVVNVMDYNLRVSDNHLIRTVLYGESKSGAVTFSIVKAPQNGRALIDGDILYYSPLKNNLSDKIVIEAKDVAGNTAQFNVTINRS